MAVFDQDPIVLAAADLVLDQTPLLLFLVDLVLAVLDSC